MIRGLHRRDAALAGCALLVAFAGCGEAGSKSKALVAASSRATPSSSSSPSGAPASGAAVRLDSPPEPVAPEQRLKQHLLGKQIVIDTEGKWAAECSIHRACRVKPQILKVCDREPEGEVWGAEFAHRAEHFTDPQVAIEGQLVMSDAAFSTAVGCDKGACCNGRRAPMMLAGPPYDLELVGLGCVGDESRLCCALSARGEEVIATGRLTYDSGRLRLRSPELCRRSK